MAGGSWGFIGNGDEPGSKPVSLDAWSREFLGWTTPLTPTTSQALTMEPALASPNTTVKLANASYLPKEYWLAENRYPVYGSWDEGLGGLLPGYPGGLLVTHVDNGISTLNSNDFNRYGTAPHQGVVPEQGSIYPCDMLASGSANSCRGSARTTFYVGNNTDFGDATMPDSSYYNGSSSGMAVNAISACGPTMTASITVPMVPDKTKPVVATFTVPSAWNSLTVPVTAFIATDNVAVASYMVTASSTVPQATDVRWSPTPPASYTFTSTGTKYLYAWAKDTSNYVSSAKSASVLIDLTVPSVSSFSIPASYNALTVPVTLGGYDNTKVIGAYYLSENATSPGSFDPGWMSSKPSSYRFDSVGVHVLYAWVKDPAGNVSPSKSAKVFIDTVPPTVGDFDVPSLVTALTIPVQNFTASDDVDGSGIGGYLITETAPPPLASASGWSSSALTSYTTSAGGQKTLYAWVKDKAGNVSAAMSAIVVIDASRPVITAFTIPAASASLDVPILTFTASDDLAVASYMVTESSAAPVASDSRWQATPPAAYTASAAGKKALYGWVKDSVGHVSYSKSVNVVIDLTPPVISSLYLPASYSTLSVPVTLKASDNIGVVSYYLSESSSAPSVSDPNWKTRVSSYTFSSAGVHTLYAWCQDKAGNVSLPQSATVVIQPTAQNVDGLTVPFEFAGLGIRSGHLVGPVDGAFGIRACLDAASDPSSPSLPAGTSISRASQEYLCRAKHSAGNVCRQARSSYAALNDRPRS